MIYEKSKQIDIAPLKELQIMGMGGTWNSTGDNRTQGTDDRPRLLSKPVGEEFLKRFIKPAFASEISSKKIAEKHSSEITDKHIAYLLDSIARSEHKNILVTMGAFDLPRISDAIANYLEMHKNMAQQKKIILASSYMGFGELESDAPANMGAAIAALNLMDNGFGIVINGELFKAGELVRDRSGNYTYTDPSKAGKPIAFGNGGGTVGSVWSAAVDTAVISEDNIPYNYFEKSVAPPYAISPFHVAAEDSRNITNRVREIYIDETEDLAKQGINATDKSRYIYKSGHWTLCQSKTKRTHTPKRHDQCSVQFFHSDKFRCRKR